MTSEFHKDKTQMYTKGLLAVAVLLGALMILRIAGFVSASSEAQALAGKVDPNGRDANDVNKLLASAKATAEELKKKNLFVKIPPRQHPVNEVLGILGDEALINGQWHKVGDSIGEAKILAIDPTKVKIAWDGQEKEFSPIGSGGSGGGGPERPGPSRPGGKPESAGNIQKVATRAMGGPMGAPSAASSEERDRARQEWQNMTPEERQRIRQEARQRLGKRAP